MCKSVHVQCAGLRLWQLRGLNTSFINISWNLNRGKSTLGTQTLRLQAKLLMWFCSSMREICPDLSSVRADGLKHIEIKPVLLRGCEGIPSSLSVSILLWRGGVKTTWDSHFLSLSAWEDMVYIKQQVVNLHCKYHSLPYGETSSRTGGDTCEDDQFGQWSSTQRFTCWLSGLLQVCGCFGNSDGIGHCSSGDCLFPAFFHVHAIVRPGEEHFLELIESCLKKFDR